MSALSQPPGSFLETELEAFSVVQHSMCEASGVDEAHGLDCRQRMILRSVAQQGEAFLQRIVNELVCRETCPSVRCFPSSGRDVCPVARLYRCQFLVAP